MRTGRQEPTFSNIGKYAYSDGDAVADMFAEDGGATFYPAQRQELRLMLARNSDGSPAAQTIGISKPRQNGKSYSARYYAVYMADFEHRQVMYSAHHSSTTKKMFDALCNLFENKERFPEFAKDVKNITRGRGYEGIYFKDWKDEDGTYHDGGCIEFSTRTNSGARGGTYSVIIIDEAQEMTEEEQEAMLPTISASSDARDKTRMPQQIYLGTPPAPTCRGTVFRRMRDTAHLGGAETWWLEWSIEELKEISNNDVIDLAYETNPAMGYRIAEKTVQSEFEQMSMDGFARERLGWWTPIAVHGQDFAIDASAWEACRSTEPKPEGKTAYGVKFSADGSVVSLCGAVQPTDGSPARISLIDMRPTAMGTQWLADWLNARYETASCVVIDGRNGVDVLVDKIASTWKYKGSVIRPGMKDVIAAVSMLTDALSEQKVTWFDGQDILNDSATTATKRPIGGGWGFGGDNSTPIEACSLALYGVKTCKRDPSKKMRIG